MPDAKTIFTQYLCDAKTIFTQDAKTMPLQYPHNAKAIFTQCSWKYMAGRRGRERDRDTQTETDRQKKTDTGRNTVREVAGSHAQFERTARFLGYCATLNWN